MRWPCLLLLVLLAGCGQAPASHVAPAEERTDFSDLGLEATDRTGLVRGVVVDEAIRPIEGAVVRLDGEATYTTDAAGRFGFSKVDAGVHRVAVEKPGFEPQERAVEVVAGLKEPPALKLVLRRLPGTEPFAVPLEWTGAMDCSANVAGVFFSGCGVPAQAGLVDDSRRLDTIAAPPAFIQSELVWRSTQRLGDNLCMRHYAMEGGSLSGRFEPDACGPSPQIQRMDGGFIAAERIGNGTDIERVVWVAQRADAPIGLALSQDFTVYTHLFYNFVPDPAWSFVAHGAPVVP